MTAVALNDFGCAPDGRRCLAHDDEMACSHVCESNRDWYKHVGECDDPPPPARSAGHYDGCCIGCGRQLWAGELVREYEEGCVHADGCPGQEGSEPS